MSSAALKNRQLRPRRGDHVGNAFPAEAGGTSDAGGMNRVIPLQSFADDLVYPRSRIVGQHQAVRTMLLAVAILAEDNTTKPTLLVCTRHHSPKFRTTLTLS